MGYAAVNFTREQVAAMCAKYGPQVGPLPSGVDGAQLLWGMSGVESSFGANCAPRHEPAYDKGGKYSTHAPMPALLALYGSPAAASSYGPWQLMLCNAGGMGPAAFEDIDQAAHASVAALNGDLRRFNPQSLAEVGEIWNAGHITPDPGYVAKLEAAYAVPLAKAAAQLDQSRA